MKEFIATITQRSQVTIPAEVRRVLGLKPRDKVAFTIEDGRVRLESADGSVKPVEMPEDVIKISREVKDAKAEKTARELDEG